MNNSTAAASKNLKMYFLFSPMQIIQNFCFVNIIEVIYRLRNFYLEVLSKFYRFNEKYFFAKYKVGDLPGSW